MKQKPYVYVIGRYYLYYIIFVEKRSLETILQYTNLVFRLPSNFIRRRYSGRKIRKKNL